MNSFSAATIDEAVAKAEQALKKSRDEMKITVVQRPRHGFLGIGRRSAKITVTVIKKPAPSSAASVAKPAHPHPASFQASQPVNRHSSPKNRAPMQQRQRPVKKNQHHRHPERHRHTANHRKSKSVMTEAEMEQRHQANVAKTKAVSADLTEYLHGILAAMGIKTEVVVTAVRAHEVTVDIKSDKSGRVIGHHGRRINALEALAGAFMDYHGVDNAIVTVDTANYREKRRKALSRVAENAVVDVISTNQAVFLDPMPARERKQIHRQLEHNSHVVTYSNGREPYRSVVIAPKN